MTEVYNLVLMKFMSAILASTGSPILTVLTPTWDILEPISQYQRAWSLTQSSSSAATVNNPATLYMSSAVSRPLVLDTREGRLFHVGDWGGGWAGGQEELDGIPMTACRRVDTKHVSRHLYNNSMMFEANEYKPPVYYHHMSSDVADPASPRGKSVNWL